MCLKYLLLYLNLIVSHKQPFLALQEKLAIDFNLNNKKKSTNHMLINI